MSVVMARIPSWATDDNDPIFERQLLSVPTACPYCFHSHRRDMNVFIRNGKVSSFQCPDCKRKFETNDYVEGPFRQG